MSDWISVEERLPEPNVLVLIWGTWHRLGVREEEGHALSVLLAGEWQGTDEVNYHLTVTHWMPLPEGPG